MANNKNGAKQKIKVMRITEEDLQPILLASLKRLVRENKNDESFWRAILKEDIDEEPMQAPQATVDNDKYQEALDTIKELSDHGMIDPRSANNVMNVLKRKINPGRGATGRPNPMGGGGLPGMGF